MTGDPLDRLRQQIAKSRATYVPGTPEKYTKAELRGFTVLEAEELLREHDALVEVARAAREVDGNTVFTPEWYRARFALRAALARLDGHR